MNFKAASTIDITEAGMGRDLNRHGGVNSDMPQAAEARTKHHEVAATDTNRQRCYEASECKAAR